MAQQGIRGLLVKELDRQPEGGQFKSWPVGKNVDRGSFCAAHSYVLTDSYPKDNLT
jgi:hypothetical protein